MSERKEEGRGIFFFFGYLYDHKFDYAIYLYYKIVCYYLLLLS